MEERGVAIGAERGEDASRRARRVEAYTRRREEAVGPARSSRGRFRAVRARLGRSGLSWAGLDRGGPVWTGLSRLGRPGSLWAGSDRQGRPRWSGPDGPARPEAALGAEPRGSVRSVAKQAGWTGRADPVWAGLARRGSDGARRDWRPDLVWSGRSGRGSLAESGQPGLT